MTVAEEIPQLNDCFLVNLDLENCPTMAEIPLSDFFNIMVTSSTLDENYLDVLTETIVGMLEDAMRIPGTTRTVMLSTGFAVFEVCEGGLIIFSAKDCTPTTHHAS